ncbi:hypothetical protein ARMSODRAFT_1014253 [Armillaria solidipes]|uniref:F-box domain-containing protein n=1 Tax=Armillaria solidipes TaxID=1076256 RepID=A0A2H3BY57_9AGAR|nr:hypothetical protein ARMSODRAFT_1014253 [Armillaria solidipes]
MSNTTPTDEFPQLPQELVNTVIDHLSDDTSLRSCSMVNRAWTEHAQKKIFHKQRFWVSDDPRGNLHKFRDLLRVSPHLGAFVKDIKLCADGFVKWVPVSKDCEVETVFPEVFPLLNNMKIFSFELTKNKVWDQIVAASVADALKSILRTAFLTDIRLSWMTFDLYSDFIRLLSDLVAVRELDVSAITIGTYDVAKRVDNHKGRLPLISLRMNLSAALLELFTQWLLSNESRFGLGEIRSLTVLSYYDYDGVSTSTNALESLLKHIDTGAIIHLGLQDILSSPLCTFASLPNLKTIRLFTGFKPSTCMAWLAQDIIEGQHHAVDEFNVDLKIFNVQEGLPANSVWQALDSIASTCCHVQVRVVFMYLVHWESAVSRFTNEIQAALPDLHRKRLLHLDFECFSNDEADLYHPGDNNPSFFANITTFELCESGLTNSGHIGLKGDTEEKPKRSFFWYFSAEHDAENAPVTSR